MHTLLLKPALNDWCFGFPLMLLINTFNPPPTHQLEALLTCSSSPQGRIFQVEYAQEAVKQGSVVVGIVSKTHAVLAALKVHVLPSVFPTLNSPHVAQRRRALILPEEGHSHRLPLWHRSRRPSL
jgi:hypothetical protein